MGTNYYAVIIPSKKRKEELCNIINSDNFDEITSEVNKTYGYFDIDYDGNPVGGKIHLGKCSGGWKFLWNPNVYTIRHGHTVKEELEPGHYKYTWIEEPDTYYHIYPLTKEGIWNFINREDVKVFDEYNEEQDKKEFFDMAVNWTTWNGEEALDGESYEEKNGPSIYLPKATDSNIVKLSKAGYFIEYPYTDFYSDGLRFSTSTNFS